MEIVGQDKSESPKHLKVFELIQKDFAIIGITSNLAHQAYPFNGRILLGFLLLCSNICFVFVFSVNDAEQFAEYAQCVNILSLMALNMFAFLILIVNVKPLFEFIDVGNDLVNISECDIKSESPWTLLKYSLNIANIL